MVFYAAVYCILLVAAVLLWMAATATGLRDNIEKVIADLIASGKFHFVGWELFRAGAVGGAMLVVLGTATNVLLVVLYNLISDLVGGVSIVVEERPSRAGRKRPPRSAQPHRSAQPPRVAEEPRAAEAPEVPVPARAPKILIPEVERRQAPQPVPAPTPVPAPAPQPQMPEQQLSGAERVTDTNLEAFGL